MSWCRIVPSRRFRADLRKIQQNGGPLDQIAQTVEALAAGERPSGTDRPLGENLSGCRECAVAPGYLLVYRYWGNLLVLYLLKTPKNAGGFSMFLLTEIKSRRKGMSRPRTRFSWPRRCCSWRWSFCCLYCW